MMPSGPQPRNPCCCACNKKGFCLQCVSVKNGKHCVNCLPSRLGMCSNYESSPPQSSVTAASSRSSVAVQHVLSSVLSGNSLATSSPHHNPPRVWSPGSTNFSDRVVSLSPSSPQGDLFNGATLPSSRTSTIPDLDSIFHPKFPTLQHVPKGARSAWASLLSDMCSDISKAPANLSKWCEFFTQGWHHRYGWYSHSRTIFCLKKVADDINIHIRVDSTLLAPVVPLKFTRSASSRTM